MRQVQPPKPVIVRRDGYWCDGEIRAWRRDRAGWSGYVCYAVSPGLRHLEWINGDRVRPA